MGGGSWNVGTYRATTSAKISSGTTFGYDSTAKRSGRYEAHESLDPKKLNSVGQNIRECRDNDEHPNSVPIVVGFDATGSMGSVPRVVQQKLAGLFGLLLRKGYVEDPQISISAYGDAFCDRVPLQISQFESDNRIDDNLDNLFLEGGGGGNSGETQSLLWYYLLNHVETDAWEKRKKKGYLFLIADEVPLQITPAHVKEYIGDAQPLSSLANADMVKALQEKWNVIVLLIDNSTAHWQGSEAVYKKLFGAKNVLLVEDAENVAEVIGLAIGVKEGMVDSVDQAEDDLKDAGANAVAIRGAVDALGGLIGLAGTGGVLAKGSLNLDLEPTGAAARL